MSQRFSPDPKQSVQHKQEQINNTQLQQNTEKVNAIKESNFDSIQTQSQNIVRILTQMEETVARQKENLLIIFENISSSIMNYIKEFKDFTNQATSNTVEVKHLINCFDQQIQLVKKQIEQQLRNLDKVSKMDYFVSLLESLEIKPPQGEVKPFEYRLLGGQNKQQKEWCFAVTFNEDASVIFYGCNKLIKVNQFDNGAISKELQQLNSHFSDITCLNFLNKTKQLISASCEEEIIIWNLNNSGLWNFLQRLDGHRKKVNCLTINRLEDLLISGSEDQTIKFWQRENQHWGNCFSINVKIEVYGISFDDQQQQLIACGNGMPAILVIKQNHKKEWFIFQIINVEDSGFRLCFIDSDLFAFQPNRSNQLEIYQLNQQKQEYKKINEVNVQGGNAGSIYSPCQYVKQKELLIVKNNHYINVIRVSNSQFVIQQSIQFQTSVQYGGVTQDGTYMVTWDSNSEQFQVRKLNYLE